MTASDECFLFIEQGGQRWPCGSGDTIGRAGSVAGEVLRGVETLSRRHLQIEKRGSVWHVVALPDTRNVTFMDGQPMQRGVAYPLLGVRTFRVDQFQFYMASASGMMTQAWPGAPPEPEPAGRLPLPVAERGDPPLRPLLPREAPSAGGGLDLDELPAAALLTDLRLNIIGHNAAAGRWLGEVRGRDLDELTPERTRLRDLLLNAGQGEETGGVFPLGEPPRRLEVRARRGPAHLLVTLRDASAEEERRRRLEGEAALLARRLTTLSELSVSEAFRSGDVARSLSLLTVRGAEGMPAASAGVWMAEGEGRTLRLEAAHPQGSGTGPLRVEAACCPAFFDPLWEQGWVEAEEGPLLDVLREISVARPATRSLLAVVLRQGEDFHGMVVWEREEISRWEESDRHFGRCLAGLALAALQSAERREAMERLRAREEHMRRELAEAERYVRRILPPPLLEGPVTTEWEMLPSEQVGGDSFGYQWLGERHLVLYILDVVGHGIGAALLSISVLNALRSRLAQGSDVAAAPAEILRELNESFPMEQQNGMTFTMWCGCYDHAERRLTYASGGHPPAVLLLGTAGPEGPDYASLATEGPVLGGLEGITFQQESVEVPPGSKLFLCTDGAFEIPLGSGREWTFEEFIAAVRSTRWMEGGEPPYLRKRISALCGADRFPDDFAIVRFSFDR